MCGPARVLEQAISVWDNESNISKGNWTASSQEFKWEMSALLPDMNCNPWLCESLCTPSLCQPSSQSEVSHDIAECGSLDEPAVPTVDEDDVMEAGVGICFRRIKLDDRPVMRVVSTAAGGPAKEESLIEPGMILTHIDRISIADKSTPEIGKLILGPVGSEVLLRFASPAGPTREVSLRRKHLPRERGASSQGRDRAPSSEVTSLTQDDAQQSWWSSFQEVGTSFTASMSPLLAETSNDENLDAGSITDTTSSPRSHGRPHAQYLYPCIRASHTLATVSDT